jgi:hypothetical protein
MHACEDSAVSCCVAAMGSSYVSLLRSLFLRKYSSADFIAAAHTRTQEAAQAHWVRHYGVEVNFPDGAQRNWLYIVSEPQTMTAPALAALEAMAQRFREVS